jgi:MoaA/NifB/PqqE/SkfB family radical SAM enzyme
MIKWSNIQYTIEKLRPYIGSVYPLVRKALPQSLLKPMTVPLRASFLLTNRCNARCNFCMVGPYFQDATKHLTLDNFKVIARNMDLGRYGEICLSGAGEPMLNPDLPAIVGFVNRKYPRMLIHLTTNGIALKGELMRTLARLDIDKMAVSLNAGTRETYRKTMGVDRFEEVIENIQRYQALIRETHKQVMLSFVAHKGNIADLLAYVKLAHFLQVKNISVRYAKFYPPAHRAMMGGVPLKDDDSLFNHQRYSDEVIKEAEVLNKTLDMNLEHIFDPLFSEPCERQLCYFPFREIIVGMDGEVFPCCGGETIFKDKVASGQYDFGNLLRQKAREFKNNQDWQAIRYSALHADSPTVPECAVCSIGVNWDGHIKKRHIMEWDDLPKQGIDFKEVRCKK